MITKKVLVTVLLLFLYISKNTANAEQIKKPWTVMIYMAASNDLAIFAPRNIAQMQKIGSNEQVNIIVHHNTYEKKKHRSRTYYIHKGSKELIEEQWDTVDSGSPQNLIDFCTKTIYSFPAEQYALIFWNHGSGAIEPTLRSNFSAEELFSLTASKTLFNNNNTLISPFPTFEKIIPEIHRGVCFNDSTNKFLTEQHITYALKTICETSLQRGRFSLIGFDACFMAMIEVALAMQPYAHLMVASQDVEKGSGWNYKETLSLFLTETPDPLTFATHIVTSYAKTYKTMNNFTQSCIVLDDLEPLSNTLFELSTILQQIVKKSATKFFTTTIKTSRNKHLCTHFDEPDFIDLGHFLKNILTSIDSTNLKEEDSSLETVAKVKNLVAKSIQQLNTAVYKSLAGIDFPYANGLSIYFPERLLHSSYTKTTFAHKTNWHLFLKTYLSAPKK